MGLARHRASYAEELAGRFVRAPCGFSRRLAARLAKISNKNNEPARTGKSGRVALIGAGDRGGVSADRGCNSGPCRPVRLLVSASRQKVQADFGGSGGNFLPPFFAPAATLREENTCNFS